MSEAAQETSSVIRQMEPPVPRDPSSSSRAVGGWCSAVPLTGVTLIRARCGTGGGNYRKSDRPERPSSAYDRGALPPQRSRRRRSRDQRGSEMASRDGIADGAQHDAVMSNLMDLQARLRGDPGLTRPAPRRPPRAARDATTVRSGDVSVTVGTRGRPRPPDRVRCDAGSSTSSWRSTPTSTRPSRTMRRASCRCGRRRRAPARRRGAAHGRGGRLGDRGTGRRVTLRSSRGCVVRSPACPLSCTTRSRRSRSCSGPGAARGPAATRRSSRSRTARCSRFDHVGEPYLLYVQESWSPEGEPVHFERGFLRPGAGPRRR